MPRKASGLSDFYRLEREELQRRGKDSRVNVAAAGAPVPSAKALGQLHADVLRVAWLATYAATHSPRGPPAR